MDHIWKYFVVVWLLVIMSTAWAECPVTGESNVQLQVLGSGGPRESAGRASTAYVLWIDGVARMMVDSGSGTKVNFHNSGANFNDIDLVALSHLHPDHSAELPAKLWPAGGSFRVAGPSGFGLFPSLDSFLQLMFSESGAFGILADRIDLEPMTVDVTAGEPVEVWRDGDILVRGIGVPHGGVPSVGYRVDVGDYSVAFSGDQTGTNPAWTSLARDVNVLVTHFGAVEQAAPNLLALHAPPSAWGQMAADTNAGHVLVSHIATSSDQVLEDSVDYLRVNYSGPVTVAEDLMCIEVI